MRFPQFINENTKIVYTPSPAALELIGESDRKLFAENFQWDSLQIPSLSTLCIEVIAKCFENRPLLNELACADKYHLLELLSTEIPLEIAVPLIEDELYWKRRYLKKFGIVKDRKYEGWNWKSLFIERYLREVIEQAQHEYSDEEYMEDLLKLLNPYIKRLKITQLRAWKPPLTWQKDEIPENYPIDHINFEPIFRKLEFITELDICYTMKNIGMDFKWQCFELSILDCSYLGKAILYLKLLKTFKLHQCAINDDHLRALLENLIKHKTLEKLDFSNCKIGSTGALCLAKVMLTMTTLRHLNISNNTIGETGAEGIGYALLQPECCELTSLNLKLNPLKHEGVMPILSAVVRGAHLTELSVAATMFGDDTGMRVADILRFNNTLIRLDISSNWIDEEHVEPLVVAVCQNRTLQWMDLRECDIPQAAIDKIKKCLDRNRLGLDHVEDEYEESELISDEEESTEEDGEKNNEGKE